MIPASLIPDFQVQQLMRQHRIPRQLRPHYLRWLRTGHTTKRLATARRVECQRPLDDNRFAMCSAAIQNCGLDNIAEGIRGWTSGGQPLYVVG